MLHFLSSVFATKRERGAGPDKALIERAIERVVDGTDPRLRGLGNYRKRLRTAVEKAVIHVIDVVDALPQPAEINRGAYSADPRLRAFFVSASHLQEVIGGSLDAMKAGNWGLEPIFSETETTHPDYAALESEIDVVEAQLLELGTRPGSLEACYENINETLGRPEDWIAKREIHLNLDHMLIKTDASSTRRSSQLELTELFSCAGERRIVLLGRFPRQELPEQRDFLEQVERYLH